MARLFLIGIATCMLEINTTSAQNKAEATDSLRYPQEKHLANIRQLTFGGDNAEAYWSFDSRKLVFQATREEWNASCDQIFMV